MGGDDPLPLFHVFEVEDRIPVDHPPRDIQRRGDRILAAVVSAKNLCSEHSREGITRLQS